MNAVTLYARCLNAVTASTLQRCSPLYIKGGSAAFLAAFPTLESQTALPILPPTFPPQVRWLALVMAVRLRMQRQSFEHGCYTEKAEARWPREVSLSA